MKLGDFELHSLSDGLFGLDGGAMFGVIPRPVWQKTNPPDDRNRIRLALRPLLVVAGPHRILIDAGIGDKEDEKFRDLYRIEKTDTLDASLGRAGFAPAEITHVVLTHLHFDHCGGATRLDAGGRVAPRFPNARYVVQRLELELARNPNRRSRAAYLAANFEPLAAAGLLDVIDGDCELAPGVRLARVGGHTPGLMLAFIESGNRTAVFCSDLIPTRAHIATPYIMGYDLTPLETMEQKEKLVGRAAAGHWLCFLGHDTEHPAGFLVERDGAFSLQPLPAAAAAGRLKTGAADIDD
jgi:glyoxylase-like metal-dependent hydrolase (beta-lactamase superfamily II)